MTKMAATACGGHFYFQVVWLLSAAPEGEGESALTPRLSFVMFHFRWAWYVHPLLLPRVSGSDAHPSKADRSGSANLKAPVSEIAEDALVHSRKHKRSWQDDESRMKRLVEWWGGREAEGIATSEMERQRSDAARDVKWAPSTFHRYRSLLTLTYREARRSGKVNVNPARDVRHRREDNSRVRYLNQFEPARTEVDYLKPLKTEEARLRAVIEHDYLEHLLEFELALNTGLGKGSMYSLTWAMVDWRGRMLNIPTSKNGEALHILLNYAALAALENLHQRGEKIGRVFQSEKTGEPLANSRHWFEKAVIQAGINDFVWHDLRHCFRNEIADERREARGY
jgi:integrase